MDKSVQLRLAPGTVGSLRVVSMKRSSKWITILLIVSFATCFFLFGCSESEEKYALSVTGSELLYESLKDSYKAGEEVTVKVKITPNENTVAYLDLMPLAKVKSSQDNYYTFTFTMPNQSAVLWITNLKGFEEPLLLGFYLTFTLDGELITSFNKEVEDSEAVADFCYFGYSEEGVPTITMNDGADVFADGHGKTDIEASFGLSRFEFENTLYFTYELLGASAWVDWVYCNQQTGEIQTQQGVGNTLDDVGIFSTADTQSLEAVFYNVNGEEYKATFDSKVTVHFSYIDYLTGVKVLEYDKDNHVIKSSDFTGKIREETYTAGDSCEYVVIEEEYTVMNDEAHKGEKHYERTLINKNSLGGGKTLKYPRGDGLISPIYLEIVWAEYGLED